MIDNLAVLLITNFKHFNSQVQKYIRSLSAFSRNENTVHCEYESSFRALFQHHVRHYAPDE